MQHITKITYRRYWIWLGCDNSLPCSIYNMYRTYCNTHSCLHSLCRHLAHIQVYLCWLWSLVPALCYPWTVTLQNTNDEKVLQSAVFSKYVWKNKYYIQKLLPLAAKSKFLGSWNNISTVRLWICTMCCIEISLFLLVKMIV